MGAHEASSKAAAGSRACVPSLLGPQGNADLISVSSSHDHHKGVGNITIVVMCLTVTKCPQASPRPLVGHPRAAPLPSVPAQQSPPFLGQ